MAVSAYDLAIDVVLFLVATQRRAEDGQELSYADIRAELLTLLNEQEQRSHSEPGLTEAWRRVCKPLVYLVDEVFILNLDWTYRGDWANDCLEVQLLGHPEALGGENFYNECDDALKELESAERHQRSDVSTLTDIVMVYYVAMQTGFKGRYRSDLDAWREYKAHIFSKLPAYAQTKTRELFPETDDHTTSLDPNYEPVMRLMYVLIGLAVLVALYLGATYGTWEAMTSELDHQASELKVPTSQQSS